VALGVLPWWTRTGLSPAHSRVVLALGAYVLGFGLMVTLAQKKFDRYLLPAFPMLDLLAGLGLWLAWRAFRLRVSERSRVLPLLCVLALAVLVVWPTASVFPHYLTYYNPVLGGGPAAARMILVGYGEGLIDAARWFNLRPDAEGLTVAADSHDVFQAAFIGQAVPLSDRPPESAAYVVLYHYQSQIHLWPRVLATYRNREPEHVIRLNGIEYARIYRVRRADGRP
jgi:hypothetical protein